MANTSYLGSNVETTDSFSGWIDKTNKLIFSMGTEVVTSISTSGAEPNTVNGGYTSGNAALAGVFTANTIAVSEYLRGGTVTSNAGLVITSNAEVQGVLTYIKSTNTTIGDAGTDVLNINAVSDFNANVNVDGVLTQTANAVFSGVLVNITSVNTTIGDAGTDKFNVNAESDFNANVAIDGIFIVSGNAIFSGANVNINGNTTIGDLSSDRLIVTATLSSDLIPLDSTIDLGSSANAYGNVHTTNVYTANAAISNTLAVTNTVNVGVQANVASIMVRNLTSSRIPYSGLGGQVTDSANLTFSGTNLNIIGTANVTSNANVGGTLGVTGLTTLTTANVTSNANVGGTLGVTGATTLSTVSTTGAASVGSTLGVTGLATLTTANITSTAMVVGTLTLNSGLSVNGAITAANTLNVAGLSTLATANVTGLSTLNTVSITGTTTANTLNINGTTTANTLNATGLATLATSNVTGLATMASANITGTTTANTLSVTGTTTANTLNINGTTTANTLVINGTTSTNAVSISGVATLSSDLVLSGSTARSIKADFGASALSSINFTVSNSTVGSTNTVLIANTSGLFGSANITYDLGSAGVSWRNVYASQANLATLGVSGNITVVGDVIVGGTLTTSSPINLTLNAAASNTSSVTSLLTVYGNTVLGDASTDIVTLNASVASNMIPAANVTYTLGNTSYQWSNIYSNTVTANTISHVHHNTSSTSATLATITQTAIASFSATSFGSAEITITAKQSTSRHITKLLVVHNGSTALATEYGSILTGSSLATYEVDISGGNVRLLATSASSTSTVYNVVLTLINA